MPLQVFIPHDEPENNYEKENKVTKFLVVFHNWVIILSIL